MTFDTGLMHSVIDAPDLGMSAGPWKETPVEGVILELKFTEVRPSWVDDLIQVFQAAKYELDSDAGWVEGDWNADRRFDSGDLIAAFTDGGYERGPSMTARAVPEPSALLFLATGVLGATWYRRMRRPESC